MYSVCNYCRIRWSAGRRADVPVCTWHTNNAHMCASSFCWPPVSLPMHAACKCSKVNHTCTFVCILLHFEMRATWPDGRRRSNKDSSICTEWNTSKNNGRPRAIWSKSRWWMAIWFVFVQSLQYNGRQVSGGIRVDVYQGAHSVHRRCTRQAVQCDADCAGHQRGQVGERCISHIGKYGVHKCN